MRRGSREWFLKYYIAVTLFSTLILVYNDPNIIGLLHEADNTMPLSAEAYNRTFCPEKTTEDGILVIDEKEAHERYLDVSYSGRRRRLPHCLIIGAAKCGTEALQFFLQLNPNIATDIQEFNFFAIDSLYNRGYDWFRHHMPISYPHQITIQRGTWYWDTLGVPERLHAMNNSLKVILLACEPSRRVVSWYTHKMKHQVGKSSPASFENQFFYNGRILSNHRALRSGRYNELLTRWLNYFNRSQLLIVDGEALRKNPFPEVQKAETFLGVGNEILSTSFLFNLNKGMTGFWCKLLVDPKYPSRKFNCLPASKGRKHTEVNQTSLQKIKNYFKPHNEKFYKLVDHKYNWD